MSDPRSDPRSLYFETIVATVAETEQAQFYVSGSVIIHPSAAIAANVMLQASPGSQLIIAAGVCIGMGSVIHAHQGSLEIEPGVLLGAGVLVMGSGKIGATSCVGAMTTLLNPVIEPGQIIPPNSLIGDSSRQVSLAGVSAGTATETGIGANANSVPPTPMPPIATPPASSPPASAPSKPEQPAQPTSGITTASPQVVYGRASLERVMVALFPHRQATPSPSPEQAAPNQVASDQTAANGNP